MRHLLVGLGLALLGVLAIQAPAHAILITFEEGLGNDQGMINNQYAGITFQSATNGDPWLYLDHATGNYNTSSTNGSGSGSYWIHGNVAAWTDVSGDDGEIAFNNADATFVELAYSSYGAFYLEAYDINNVLLDSDTGPANTGGGAPGTLQVNSANADIAYVRVHDSGNYWVVDNISTDATGIKGGDIKGGDVPEPASVIVWLCLGTIGITLGWYRRRRAA